MHLSLRFAIAVGAVVAVLCFVVAVVILGRSQGTLDPAFLYPTYCVMLKVILNMKAIELE